MSEPRAWGVGRLVLPTQGAPPAPSSRYATQMVRVGPFHSRGGARALKRTSRSPPTPRDRPGGEGRRGGQSRAILASRPGAPFSPGSPCKTEQSVSRLCGLRALQRTRSSPRQRFPLRSRLSKDNDQCSRQTRRPRAGSGQPAVSGGSCRVARRGGAPRRGAGSRRGSRQPDPGLCRRLPGSNPGSSAPWACDSEPPFAPSLSSLHPGFFTRNVGIGAEPRPQMCE